MTDFARQSRARPAMWIGLWRLAAPLYALSTPAGAEALPASVLSCAAVVERTERLECFDREVARYAQAAASPARVPAPPDAQPAAVRSAGDSRHVTAHVTLIEKSREGLVLHLDNGQVWKQVEAPTEDPNLHPGDAVTIEKGLFGRHWLENRSGGVLMVKQK